MKVSIHFSLASAKSEDKPIRMRISYDGLRLDLRTGFVCPPDKWDIETMRMKQGCTNRYGEKSSSINRELAKQETCIRELLDRYELDHETPEPSALKAAFDKAQGRKRKSQLPCPASETFLECYKRFIIEYGRQQAWSTNSFNVHSNVLHHIEDCQFCDKPTMEIDTEDLSRFISDLWSDGLENITVKNYITCIKTMLRWCRTKGLYDGDIPETFKPNLKGIGKKDLYFLEWEEFKKILYLDIPIKAHAEIRDAFCLCCSTGLRISDCIKLRWSDIFLSAETPYIAVMMKKTVKPVIIELNQFSRAIIDRHLHKNIKSSDLVFTPSDMKAKNNALKRYAKIAGIDSPVRKISFSGNKCEITTAPKHELISTHWGRHTFIVHALSIGISPVIVMQWTGHSSFESMKPYIAIANSAKKENMSKFDEIYAPGNVPKNTEITQVYKTSNDKHIANDILEKSLFDDIPDTF